jgi:hypothetical protein
MEMSMEMNMECQCMEDSTLNLQVNCPNNLKLKPIRNLRCLRESGINKFSTTNFKIKLSNAMEKFLRIKEKASSYHNYSNLKKIYTN